jgi:CCR4-NOT transcription complex subunit 4
MYRGHRDLTARTTGTGVISSESKSKSDQQSNSFPSSSMVSGTRIPSSWNDDSSSVQKIPEGRQISEKDSSSKTIEPYKPGIAKETQALSSLNSSVDIDFSTIPSAWNDDDIVVHEMSKESKENQVANGNEKLAHPGSKSPKKDTSVSSTSKSTFAFLSSLATPKSDVKIADGDHLVTNIAPKSPTSEDVMCHLAGGKKILEDVGPKETDIEKLSVRISSVMLNVKNEVQSMAGNQQPDAMPCTSVAGLLPLEKNTVHSYQYDSDKHLDWSSGLQSSVTPLVNSSVNTDRQPMTLLDGTDVPSYSSFIHLPDTPDTSLWKDTESNHILTTLSTTAMMQTKTKQSTTDNTYGFLNGVQDGLGTLYPSGNVSGHSGMGSHQPGAISVRTDNIGSFDKTISVNKDESRIISDILSSEFNLWDERNDVPFTMPSWKSGTSNNESRFAFARQDNQGSMSDSSLRNRDSEKNFNLLFQNSFGNVYQNGLGFQSLENSLSMSDMAATGECYDASYVPD